MFCLTYNKIYMKKLSSIIIIAAMMFANAGLLLACTNFLITKGASTDGSNMITYAADSHQLYGALYFWPSADYEEGSMLDIYEWDTGKYLGEIEQVSHTYQVTGNMNENQVIIGETTYGGLDTLGEQDGAIMDYGSLIYVTLQRAETARDALRIMTELVEKYGYASSGESFSIADENEVWIMELIGKGNFEKGAVWVALQVPDGYICSHANQARIMTFDYQDKNNWDDPEQTTFNSKDVISFAKKYGFYEGSDEDFSFSDVYAPVDFGGARFCEMRVWSFFRYTNDEFNENDEYFEYSKGNIKYNEKVEAGETQSPESFATNRMPLWIKPDRKISQHDAMNYMRDHLEETELDMSKDAGAGPYAKPYRWRPMTWEIDGKKGFNERTIATQQTGFSFVAQARSGYPDHIGGIFWFGVDDAASSVYTPIYVGTTDIPDVFREGNGTMMDWSDNSGFWIFNQVTNLAYTRYNMIHPEVSNYQQALEKKFFAYTSVIDKSATELYKSDKAMAREFLTDFTVNTGNKLVQDWKEFYQYLFMKYVDGNVKKSENMRLIDNGNGKHIPQVTFPGYDEEWYRNLIRETGNKFVMPGQE
jgi:dipeptidase